MLYVGVDAHRTTSRRRPCAAGAEIGFDLVVGAKSGVLLVFKREHLTW